MPFQSKHPLAILSCLALGISVLPAAEGRRDCLPEAPPVMSNAGVWIAFQLNRRNTPVLPVRVADHDPRHAAVSTGADLCQNYMGRSLITALSEEFAASMNEDLTGERHPVVTGLLELVADAVEPVAGALFKLLNVAADSTRSDPEFRARVGDQVWRVELAARDGDSHVYIVYLVLEDPFRSRQWLLSERRIPLDVTPTHGSAVGAEENQP